MKEAGEAGDAPAGGPGRRYQPPEARAFDDATELPDGFPGAAVLRRAGYTTYHAVLKMPPGELAALGDALGADVVQAILRLRPPP